MRWLVRPTPHVIAFIAFLAFYVVLIQDIRHWSWRDPGSAFFKPKKAFERHYSLQREAEAQAWIDAHDAEDVEYAKASDDPSMCVGIATVQREGARYFRRTVGSILAGLTERERSDIYLISFIANTDPTIHEAYNETWLPLVSDEILTYLDAVSPIRPYAHRLETTDVKWERKPLFDYTHLLRHCHGTGTPYVVILEDDVIGADGWYLRTKAALQALEQSSSFEDTIYLRLFYNERILGWNNEEWFSYLLRCVLFEGFVLGIIVTIRRYMPPATKVLTPLTIFTILFVTTPMLITAYFLAGRLTVSALPTGLNRMDKYGCCSQAFVFQRDIIPELIDFYDEAGRGMVDHLTEKYANQQRYARWALTPSVFAHVGSTSSKGTQISKWGRSNTENIWNWSFEMFDAEKLKLEHM